MLRSLFALLLLSLLTTLTAAEPTAPYRVQLDTITKGFEGKPYDGVMCYTQARAGIVPRNGLEPLLVVTMSPLRLTGSDVYYELHEMRSADLGKTWLGPFPHKETLGRRSEGMLMDKPVEVVIADFWPKWHAKSGKLLGTGHTVRYNGDSGPIHGARRDTTYAVYDPQTFTWTPWKTVAIPHAEAGESWGAGCTQRVDLPNGDILLPVYGRKEGNPIAEAKVVRCRFENGELKIVEQGNWLTLATHRGLAEPSLAVFRGKYYLTVRHDLGAYVAVSDDGLKFGALKSWTWDDGTELGSYNTQAHWVTHSDALYLVYTRKGADNDHIFRHRAPLFMAEVDVEKLHVKRKTEQVLIPQKGARYGNFGVCSVSERETWVIETEWMQRPPHEKIIPVNNQWGAEARVYAARILWEKPNQAWDRQ